MLLDDDTFGSHTHSSTFKPFWEPHCSLQTRAFIELPKNPRIWLWKHFENQWSVWFPAVCREKLSRGQEVSLPYHVVSHTLHQQEHHLEFDKKTPIRFSLEILLSCTIKAQIIQLENWHLPLIIWREKIAVILIWN